MVKRWPGYFFNITSCILHSHHVVAQQNDVHRFPLWKILNWRMPNGSVYSFSSVLIEPMPNRTA